MYCLSISYPQVSWVKQCFIEETRMFLMFGLWLQGAKEKQQETYATCKPHVHLVCCVGILLDFPIVHSCQFRRFRTLLKCIFFVFGSGWFWLLCVIASVTSGSRCVTSQDIMRLFSNVDVLSTVWMRAFHRIQLYISPILHKWFQFLFVVALLALPV